MLKELQKPLRLSFIGGGMNSSIGKIHFMASQLDKIFQLSLVLADTKKQILKLKNNIT